MIERQFVDQNFKEFLIQEYIASELSRCGLSHIKLQKTPLGEKIIIHASRPGLIVGRKGANINKLTKDLKRKFGLENPQIEISEVESIFLDSQVVADMIAMSLERFGTSKFKGVGHKMMTDAMNAGAHGIEILISGKIPGARAKRWRFYQGYLKKCGDMALTGVKTAFAYAQLKTGTIGIRVKIMPPETKLIDNIKLREDTEAEEREKEERKKAEEKKSAEEAKKKEEKAEKAKSEKKKEEKAEKSEKKESKAKEEVKEEEKAEKKEEANEK
ncbi:30S ribosomal protein S3 [Candidatus Woesearchaeota archaeon]|nr:30S ribosomal protein S3 [Candidatus Woesearchaeota archaeon]